MQEEITVYETRRRRNVKPVKRYVPLHEGGNDCKKKMKEDVKAFKDGGVYRNGTTDGAENVLQKKDGDIKEKRLTEEEEEG